MANFFFKTGAFLLQHGLVYRCQSLVQLDEVVTGLEAYLRPEFLVDKLAHVFVTQGTSLLESSLDLLKSFFNLEQVVEHRLRILFSVLSQTRHDFTVVLVEELGASDGACLVVPDFDLLQHLFALAFDGLLSFVV